MTVKIVTVKVAHRPVYLANVLPVVMYVLHTYLHTPQLPCKVKLCDTALLNVLHAYICLCMLNAQYTHVLVPTYIRCNQVALHAYILYLSFIIDL